MLDKLFMLILDMTKVAAVIIAVVFLVRLLLKKAPKKYSYILWAVVLFRLLCPVTIESAVSLVPQMESISDSYTLEEDSISVLDASVAAYRAVGDALNGGLGIQHIHTSNEDENGDVYVTSSWWEVWVLFGQYVWVAGIGVLLIYSVISYFKLRRKLVGAVLLRDNIYVADHITSPFVMGLANPMIYLPSSLSEKEQKYIILHEQHHIRRFDHIVKVLSFIALCIHWFNPLVWLAFLLSSKDMEMSCDEAVVKKLGTDIRADYSASLLSLAIGRRIIAGMPLAFGEGDTKGRIKNLAKWKKPTLWGTIAAVIIIVFVIAVCVTNEKEECSWVKADLLDDGVEINFDLEEPTQSWALYMDIYEDGELLSSGPCLVSGFKEDDNVTTAQKTFRLQVVPPGGAGTTWRGEWSVIFSYDSGVSSKFKLDLPKPNYTGWGDVLGSGEHRFTLNEELRGDDEVVLYSIILSAYPDDAVFLNDIAANDTVVQFRFVTSTRSAENFESVHYDEVKTYVSSKCLYMNPLSSVWAASGNSGYRYTFSTESFILTNDSTGEETVFELGEWEDFPWSDEEWNAMFWPGLWNEELQNLTHKYEEIRYLPLSEQYFLLNVNGKNWVVTMYDINQAGWGVWSIFEIEPDYT